MIKIDFDRIVYKERSGFLVSESDIERIEKEFNIKLPLVLKTFYIEHNGDELKTVYVNGIDGNEYGIHDISPIKYKRKYLKGSYYPEIAKEGEFEWSVRLFSKYECIKRLNLIPFACDEGGDIYCWQKATESVFIIRSDDFDNAIKVFDSIDVFFEEYSNNAK